MTDFFSGIGAEVVGVTAVVTMLVGILGLFLRSIVKGDLVTRAQHEREMQAMTATHSTLVTSKDAEFDRMVTLKDGTIERIKGEKDDWRDAYRASDARGDVLAEQVKELVHEHRTFTRFMEALAEVVNRGGQSGP